MTSNPEARIAALAKQLERTLSKEDVRDVEPCDLHVAVKGTFCAKTAGVGYQVCKGRRKRAARKVAEQKIAGVL